MGLLVIPVLSGIQCRKLPFRLRGNDGPPKKDVDDAIADIH
jgi:hypothetical protein